MRIISFPGVMQHAQQVALAVHERGQLSAYVTTFAFKEAGALGRLLNAGALPGSRRLLAQLRRRAITTIPPDMVHTYPVRELLRSLAQRGGAGPVIVDRLWDRMAREFDALVARRYVPNAEWIQGFEYTSLASFRAASASRTRRVLHLPSLDSAQFEELLQRERAAFPELARPEDAYFKRLFAQRYDRRCEEIQLADLIVANSSLTAKSHIQAGANPRKVVTVPLAAPPVPDRLVDRDHDATKPLTIIWAGTFQLRKGAHYFLQAWKALDAGPRAVVRVYGSIELPERLLTGAPDIEFVGSVPQGLLLQAFEQADVLVFPTLSDGFGMVVTEALSRGLPVITTDQAGAADLIQHEYNGLLVPAGDACALRDALRWCLDNRLRLFQMRAAAVATARRYQWADYREAMRKALGVE